jgi:hypothetical protein
VISGLEGRGVFEALELPFPSPSDREVADGKPIWQLQVERNHDKIWRSIEKKG